MKNLDYYGITMEEIENIYLKGDMMKIIAHANGLIHESKNQIKNNNHRLAGLNLDIAAMMLKYVLDNIDKEADWKAANMRGEDMQKPEYL